MADQLRTAAENALDVLDEARTYTSSESWSPSMTEECERAIRMLRAALADPAAEAWASSVGTALSPEDDPTEAIRAIVQAVRAAAPSVPAQLPESIRWKLAAIAAECSDAATVSSLDALLEGSDVLEQAAPSVPQWQPIETAPKDGTVVLLLEGHETEPFIGRWNDFRSRWVASTYHYDTDGNACVIDRVYSEGVTHWMPLPAAPTDGGQG